MSHSHTHGPGEDHGHSHGPPPQSPMVPQPDPTIQAAIDQEFTPVPLLLSPDGVTAVCSEHKLEKCAPCNFDFVTVNRVSRLLAGNPSFLCPPPSNVITQKLSQMVTATKDEGNALFKSGHSQQAVQRYTAAALLATQRPPWEANQFMKDELSTAISNRSAAYYDLGDYVSALADADTVIAIRKNWSKGHFRKGKALLAMHRHKEAAEAVRLGLDFEPTSQELLAFLADIEKAEQKYQETKAASKAA